MASSDREREFTSAKNFERIAREISYAPSPVGNRPRRRRFEAFTSDAKIIRLIRRSFSDVGARKFSRRRLRRS